MEQGEWGIPWLTVNQSQNILINNNHDDKVLVGSGCLQEAAFEEPLGSFRRLGIH